MDKVKALKRKDLGGLTKLALYAFSSNERKQKINEIISYEDKINNSTDCINHFKRQYKLSSFDPELSVKESIIAREQKNITKCSNEYFLLRIDLCMIDNSNMLTRLRGRIAEKILNKRMPNLTDSQNKQEDLTDIQNSKVIPFTPRNNKER